MSVSQEMRAGEVILFYLHLAYASCLCVLAFREGQTVTAGHKKGHRLSYIPFCDTFITGESH